MYFATMAIKYLCCSNYATQHSPKAVALCHHDEAHHTSIKGVCCYDYATQHSPKAGALCHHDEAHHTSIKGVCCYDYAIACTHPKLVYLAIIATMVGPTIQAPPATIPNTPLMKPVTGT